MLSLAHPELKCVQRLGEEHPVCSEVRLGTSWQVGRDGGRFENEEPASRLRLIFLLIFPISNNVLKG